MAKLSYQRDNLSKALGIFLEAFRPYVVSLLTKEHGEKGWQEAFEKLLLPDQKRVWDRGLVQGTTPENLIDFGHLKPFAQKYKTTLRELLKIDPQELIHWLGEITKVRNKVSHFQSINDIEVRRAYDAMALVAQATKMNDLEHELLRLQQPPTEDKKRGTANQLLPWYHVVRPQFDIRQGKLDESIFAANLAEVALGTGPEIYQNASLFFSKTYFTQGLRTVASRVIKGLNGQEDSENRVISLQTGFGGGKTHILISLFHLARSGKKGSEIPVVKELYDSIGKPNFEKANIAVFTNTTNDPAQGRSTSQEVKIRTMWGELAYQLGGVEAFEIVRVNDETRTAPAGLFKKVLDKYKPALILVDELADYCVKASAQPVGSSDLSDQTISFVQELSEAVAATNNCVLVATLPASETEVATSPQAGRILTSLQNRLARVGADTKPVADDEIYEVIRRRLFEELGDPEAIERVIASYNTLYHQLRQDLPSHAVRAEYKEKLRKSYPFHPELIDVFRVRWASNHEFQRTRGVLRLLASIVSDLWRRQHSLPGTNFLIHTSDVYLENLDALTGQLKKLYGNGYDAVISADVSGSSSNAHKIDDEKPEYGQHNLTKGIAATILLNSFGSDGPNKGTGIADIKLCVMRPESFSHFSVNGTLDELEAKAYYLYYSSSGSVKRYWFHTKPNVNILVNKTKNDISNADVDAEIIRRLKESTYGINQFKVLVDPGDEIPEQHKPTLIILSPRYSANPSTVNGNTRPIIEKIATKKGNAERKYRNTILFLLCSEQAIGKLQSDVREYLACQQIKKDYSTQLDQDQKSEIQKRMEEASRQTERSIVVTYSIIAKHTAKNLEVLILNQGEFKDRIDVQIATSIVERLKTEEWLLDAVGAQLLRINNLYPKLDEPILVQDVYEAFLRFDDKPMITGPEAVQSSIQKYCQNGEFAVAAGDGKMFTRIYFREPIPNFQVTDPDYWLVDKTLYRPAADPAKPGGVKEEPEPQPTGSEESGSPTGSPSARTIKRITISGKVPLDHYTQIFNSFVMPLAQNNIEIEIKITGRSTTAKPITETSQEYRVVKESARQLGLDFEEEA